MILPWHIPAPENLEDQRVTLTLGLGAAQRLFREVAAPGIGGAQFVRHCSWGVAALSLRERCGIAPSRIANAIEALACKLAFSRPKDEREGRVRGIRAFARSPDAWSFADLSQPRHYVQITFRQSVVTALADEVGLGFATGGRRFNAMTLTSHGAELAEHFLEQPVGRGGGALRRLLIDWIKGEADAAQVTTGSVRDALSPWLGENSQAEATVMQCRLLADHASMANLGTRLRARLMGAFKEVGRKAEPDLEAVLAHLRRTGVDPQARAILVAVAFEALLEEGRQVIHSAAQRLELLDLASSPVQALLVEAVASRLERLVQRAKTYLAAADDARVRHPDADVFAKEVVSRSALHRLQGLIARDGQILALGDGQQLRRGPLFESRKQVDREGAGEASDPDEGLRSPRLRQAYALWSDCRGT